MLPHGSDELGTGLPSERCQLLFAAHRIGGLRSSTSRAIFSARLEANRRDARQGKRHDVPAIWPSDRLIYNADMRPLPESTSGEVLAGLVERVTYHNSENGFCVLRAKVRGHRDVVTVVGHAATIAAGEGITASGEWGNDRTHGQQFKARFLRTSPPTSADGIEKYLSSGMIRSVGPVYAKKLVRAFGDKVFDIIEATPGRLREVDGIGPVRAASILAAWAEQKAV